MSDTIFTCVVTKAIFCPNPNRYEACTTNEHGTFFCCINCQKLLAKPNKQGQIAGESKCVRCKTINERILV